MGKRSDFKRVEKDFYRTIDPRAVAALLPFLDEGQEFVEPFAGVGDLVKELEKHGRKCSFACDIDDREEDWIHRMDAFDLSDDCLAPHYEIVISNPPWSRPILHKAIEHFGSMCETWFLFDSAWAYTVQDRLKKQGLMTTPELLNKYCTDIVAVGRLIWMPGTKMQGKDDCSWYRFAPDKNEVTRFHGR